MLKSDHLSRRNQTDGFGILWEFDRNSCRILFWQNFDLRNWRIPKKVLSAPFISAWLEFFQRIGIPIKIAANILLSSTLANKKVEIFLETWQNLPRCWSKKQMATELIRNSWRIFDRKIRWPRLCVITIQQENFFLEMNSRGHSVLRKLHL